MLLVVELLLLIATVGVIAWPLYNRRLATGDSLVDNEMSALLYKKDVAYSALTDLKFDYETGKLDDDDYAALKEQFETEAIDVMQAIDDANASEESDDADDMSAPSGSFCPHCGKGVSHSHKFCAACGGSLT